MPTCSRPHRLRSYCKGGGRLGRQHRPASRCQVPAQRSSKASSRLDVDADVEVVVVDLKPQHNDHQSHP